MHPFNFDATPFYPMWTILFTHYPLLYARTVAPFLRMNGLSINHKNKKPFMLILDAYSHLIDHALAKQNLKKKCGLLQAINVKTPFCNIRFRSRLQDNAILALSMCLQRRVLRGSAFRANALISLRGETHNSQYNRGYRSGHQRHENGSCFGHTHSNPSHDTFYRL